MILKQATQYTRLFMMIDNGGGGGTAHVSGLTGASPVVKLSKAGASGVTADNSPATQVDATNNPGLYKIILSLFDTNTLGDLGFHCTATNADPTDFIDQVQAQIFPDLVLSTAGRALVGSNIQQNTALNGYTFVMTDNVNHQAATGLTVTAQRSLGGAGFAPCANPVTELSNGVYSINLASTDTNGNTIMLRFTAPGADDLDISEKTQP